MEFEDPVEIVPYNRSWCVAFTTETIGLLSALRDASVTIEHIGGTAVPGLGGKPVVDIMLGAASMSAIDGWRSVLETLGYEYQPQAEAFIPERRFFVKRVGGRRAFHLHAVQAGSPFWVEHLAFRDRLRGDPALVAAYHRLKVELARKFRDDREAYTAGKSEFIARVLGRAAGRPDDDVV